MSHRDSTVHWSFWVIGTAALIWNVLGAINFVAQMNAEVVAAMPESHRAIIAARPLWATAAFAVAVFGGAPGCLLLLLKKSAAFYLFIASLLGVITVMNPNLDLIWYARRVQAKGWVS